MSSERGFTLVEAVVALVICTIGLVSLAELMAVTLRLQQLGRNSTNAARLAQDKIDELTTMTFDTGAVNYDPEIGCGGSLTEDDADHFDTPANAPTFKRRWSIVAGPDGDGNLRQVTVRVIPLVTDNRVTSPFELTTIIRGVDVPCP